MGGKMLEKVVGTSFEKYAKNPKEDIKVITHLTDNEVAPP